MCNINTVKPYWSPFSRSICFSYQDSLKQRYSYLNVVSCGTSSVNGTFFPIGTMNGSFVWENDNHIHLIREMIDGKLGWKFTDLHDCYYVQMTDGDFPPSDDWTCCSGMDPPPSIQSFIAGDHYEFSLVKNDQKLADRFPLWTEELKPVYLYNA